MFSFILILPSVMIVTCLHGQDNSCTQANCSNMFNTLADIKCKLENILGQEATNCASTKSMLTSGTQTTLTSGTPTTSSPTKCPEDWTSFRKSCYLFKLHDTLTNFDQAADLCQRRNAHLVYVESADENKFLKDKIKSINSDISWWIGLTDNKKEGTWKWVGTDREVTFKDWHTGAPDNLGGNENCARFDGPRYDWNDCPCNDKGYIICEKEQI